MMNKIKQAINTPALSKSSEEVCGFIVKEGSEIKILPCENSSSTPEKRFEIHPEAYLETKLKSEMIAVYHSHPINQPFSKDDILAAESYALPCVLYVNPTKEFDAYYPKYAEREDIKIVRDIIND